MYSNTALNRALEKSSCLLSRWSGVRILGGAPANSVSTRTCQPESKTPERSNGALFRPGLGRLADDPHVAGGWVERGRVSHVPLDSVVDQVQGAPTPQYLPPPRRTDTLLP